MDKRELINRVAGVTDQPVWLAGEMVEAMLGEIQIARNKGETVVIRGFSESKVSRKARPQTALRRL